MRLRAFSQKKNFEHPRVGADGISRYLDSITPEQHYMERFGLSRKTVRTFLSPVEGGGFGLGPDALSAYSDYAFGMLHPLPEENGGSDQMFSGGNATIARLMLKTLIPSAIEGSASVEGVCRGRVNLPRSTFPRMRREFVCPQLRSMQRMKCKRTKPIQLPSSI